MMVSWAESASTHKASWVVLQRERSYQRVSDQAAAPPDRNQSRSQEEQRSRRKGEQKQTGFHEEKYEIIDGSPAESPPQ